MIFESVFIGEFSKGKVRTIGTDSLLLANPKQLDRNPPTDKKIDLREEQLSTSDKPKEVALAKRPFIEEEEDELDEVDDLGCPNQQFTKLFDSYFLYNMDKLDHESSLLQKKTTTAITTIKHHNVKEIRKLA